MKSRKTLKQLYFKLLNVAGSDRRLLGNIRKQDLLVILNLHQVSQVDNPFWAPLAPGIFDDLLVFLKHNFCVSTFAELNANDDTRPRAILSFDDGYYNFIEYAMPILDKHGLKANLNVIPNCVTTGQPPWNVKLYDFLNSVPRSLINEIALPGFAARLTDDTADAKVRYGLQISRFLKNRPRREREQLLSQVSNVMSRATNIAGTRMMNLAEVKSAAGKHEIGVHSYSHESMEFESDEFFTDDFNACLDYFRNDLLLPLTIYAFPNGSYRETQITYLKAAGIERILLVGETYARRDQKVLPRFTIYGSSVAEVTIRALGYKARPAAQSAAASN